MSFFSSKKNNNNASNCLSVISEDVAMTGSIKGNGILDISGTYSGSIKTKTLIIRAGAHVVGDINAESITIYGSLESKITTNKINLMDGSSVRGEISYCHITAESNARIYATLKCINESEDKKNNQSEKKSNNVTEYNDIEPSEITDTSTPKNSKTNKATII